MHILVSSTEKALSEELLATTPWDDTLEWCEPEELADKLPGNRAVWLYQSPWSLMLNADATNAQSLRASADHWAKGNRAVLSLRGQFTSNLLLANSAHVTTAALREKLGAKAIGGQTSATPATAQEDETLLSRLFDESAPHYRTVYEALEAACWLPAGKEPRFHDTAALNEQQLFVALDTLRSHVAQIHAPRQLPKREAPEPVTESSAEEMEQLKQENELLLMQLHQVQEELEAYYLKSLEVAKPAS